GPQQQIRHVECSDAKSLGQDDIGKAGRRQEPRHLGEVCEIELAAVRQGIVHVGGDDQFVVEQQLHLQVFGEPDVFAGTAAERHDNIEAAIAQLRYGRGDIGGIDVDVRARMLL